MTLFLALLIGIAAGYRAMLAPAAVAFAARFGGLHLTGTPLAFMGYAWTPWVFAIAAVGELVTDKLPTTPSRKIPLQFGTRIISGALCGACVGATDGNLIGGLIAGIVGAVLGTYGGSAFRTWMAARLHKDLPGAIAEDIVTIVLALIVVFLV